MDYPGGSILALAIGLAAGAFMVWALWVRPNRAHQKNQTAGPHVAVSKQVGEPSTSQNAAETYWYPEFGFAIQIRARNDRAGGLSDWGFGKDQKGLSPFALDSLMSTLPTVNKALRGGYVVRVTGPRQILQGLQTGALNRLGDTGAVADKSGKIVDNLRLSDLKAVRKIVGPLAIYQLASAVTCQYYLHQITSKLDYVGKVVSRLDEGMKGKHFGHVEQARVVLDRISSLELHAISPADESDLSLAERDLRVVLRSRLDSLKTFSEDTAKRLGNAAGTSKADAVEHLIDETQGRWSEDAYLACLTLEQLVRVLVARLWIESARHPESEATRTLHLERMLDDLRAEFQSVVSNLAPLMTESVHLSRFDTIKKRLFRDKFRTLQEKLEEYQATFRPLYEMMRAALPNLGKETGVIELSKDPASGVVQGRYLLAGPSDPDTGSSKSAATA